MSPLPSPGPSMADDDQKMTVRERRAQNAKATARRTAPARLARKAIVPAIILLLVAGIAAGFYVTAKGQGKCPGHWHATFDVYVQGNDGNVTRESYRNAAFDLNGQTPLRAHMHQSDNKNQFHFEQGGLCVGVKEALGYVDTTLTANELKLDGHHQAMGQAGTYKPEGNKTLTVYVEHVSDRHYQLRNGVKVIASETLEWKKQTAKSVLDYQLKDGERILVLYGDYTEDQVHQFQAAMALPDTGRPVA